MYKCANPNKILKSLNTLDLALENQLQLYQQATQRTQTLRTLLPESRFNQQKYQLQMFLCSHYQQYSASSQCDVTKLDHSKTGSLPFDWQRMDEISLGHS